MNKIKYKINEVKGNFNGKTGKQIIPVKQDTVSMREMAELLEEKVGIPVIRTMCVMEGISRLITEAILNGKTAVIDDLGVFTPALSLDNGIPKCKKINFLYQKKLKRF